MTAAVQANENFNLFEEIKYKPLRIFNATVMLNNIFQDEGRSRANAYMQKFDTTFQKQMYVMQVWISKFGYEAARRQVTLGQEFTDEDYEGDPVQ